MGPNTNDPPVIRWRNPGQAKDIPFDLVIEAVGDYLPNAPKQNGLNGQFGQVNVKSGTEVTLKISFVDPANNDAPVTLKQFEWTFFDIDHYLYASGAPKAQEKIKVCDQQFEGSAVHPDFTYSAWSEGGCSYYQSGEMGSGCDNPTEPGKLGPITCDGRTSNQMHKAVALSFENADSIEITLQTGKGGGGRNFFFSGYSALQYLPECPIIEPPPPITTTTMAPTVSCQLACGRGNIFGSQKNRCSDYSSSRAECEGKFIRKSDSFNKLCELDGKKCSAGEQFECSAEEYNELCGGIDPECEDFCDLINIKEEGKTCGTWDGRRKKCGQHFEGDDNGMNYHKCKFDASTKTCYAEEASTPDCSNSECVDPPISTTGPTPPPTTGPTKKEDCFDGSTKFDFFEAGEPVINNLGGFGPGDVNSAPVIRWDNFGTQGTFDLVVEVISDNYTPRTPGQNGLNGNFGQVNVASGTDVTLKFSFVDHKTGKPVVVPRFEWTFFDIDHFLKADGSPKAQETIRVCDYLGAFRDDRHTFTEWTDSEGCANFQSGEFGSGCDNPLDPMALGEITCDDRTTNQLNKAVALSFMEKSSFEITLKTGSGGGGRNFFFSGRSAFDDVVDCLNITIPPTLTPTPVPTEECICLHEATLEQLNARIAEIKLYTGPAMTPTPTP